MWFIPVPAFNISCNFLFLWFLLVYRESLYCEGSKSLDVTIKREIYFYLKYKVRSLYISKKSIFLQFFTITVVKSNICLTDLYYFIKFCKTHLAFNSVKPKEEISTLCGKCVSSSEIKSLLSLLMNRENCAVMCFNMLSTHSIVYSTHELPLNTLILLQHPNVSCRELFGLFISHATPFHTWCLSYFKSGKYINVNHMCYSGKHFVRTLWW